MEINTKFNIDDLVYCEESETNPCRVIEIHIDEYGYKYYIEDEIGREVGTFRDQELSFYKDNTPVTVFQLGNRLYHDKDQILDQIKELNVRFVTDINSNCSKCYFAKGNFNCFLGCEKGYYLKGDEIEED